MNCVGFILETDPSKRLVDRIGLGTLIAWVSWIAILTPSIPIVDVSIQNPYNLHNFLDDKLSILDIKAIDANGAIYDIEMQLTISEGLVKRIVFYGCEVYVGQLNAGDDYTELRPVYAICSEEAIQLATQTITRIAEITEDKEMYDAREKAIRDRQWAMNATRREGELGGEIKGEIKLIRTLEEIVGLPQSKVEELEGMELEYLQKLTSALQDRARNRTFGDLGSCQLPSRWRKGNGNECIRKSCILAISEKCRFLH